MGTRIGQQRLRVSSACVLALMLAGCSEPYDEVTGSYSPPPFQQSASPTATDSAQAPSASAEPSEGTIAGATTASFRVLGPTLVPDKLDDLQIRWEEPGRVLHVYLKGNVGCTNAPTSVSLSEREGQVVFSGTPRGGACEGAEQVHGWDAVFPIEVAKGKEVPLTLVNYPNVGDTATYTLKP